MVDQQKSKAQLAEEVCELRASREAHRTFVREVVKGLLDADADPQKLLNANPAICRMLGYTVEEFLELSETDRVPQDDILHMITELESQPKDETIVDDLGLEREFTRATLDAFPDTLFVFEPTSGKPLRWNRAFREVCGYSDAEIAEMKAPEEFYDAKDIDGAHHALRQLAETGYAKVELPLLTKEGDKVMFEYVVTMLDQPDSPYPVSCSVGRNIAERKQAEDALRESEERFRGIFKNTSDGVAVYEAVDDGDDFVFVDFNPAGENIDKVRKIDLVGRRVTEVFKRVKEFGILDVFSRVWRSGEAEHFPITLYQDERIEGWRENFVYRLNTGEIVAVYYDITERKQAEAEQRSLEAQVQQAQKMESLGLLAGGIAHDFNNLLMGILGNASIALQELPPTSLVRENIQVISNIAKRAADLAKQMLAYSGRGRFIVAAADINEIISDIKPLLRSSVSKKLSLEMNLSENLPSIEVDVTQVCQVIINLITNASEAVGEKSGFITVKTGLQECDRDYFRNSLSVNEAEEGVYVWVEVSDSGCGMDRDTIKTIFDPFFTTKFTGRGLGLSAVLGIIRGHNGAIMVKSQVGQGTVFTVYFPASSRPITSIKEETSKDDWHGSGVILLVDDEDIVRTVCKRMLEKIGFTLLIAKDGQEAVELFKKSSEHVVCILLDLMLPDFDGEEIFLMLRLIKDDIPIIVSSGFSEKEITERFAKKGLNGFIQKPYTIEMLRGKIRQVLSSCY